MYSSHQAICVSYYWLLLLGRHTCRLAAGIPTNALPQKPQFNGFVQVNYIYCRMVTPYCTGERLLRVGIRVSHVYKAALYLYSTVAYRNCTQYCSHYCTVLHSHFGITRDCRYSRTSLSQIVRLYCKYMYNCSNVIPNAALLLP